MKMNKLNDLCERPDSWHYCPTDYCDVSMCGFWSMVSGEAIQEAMEEER